MTGKEMVFGMILAANQAVLDELKVTLRITDLEFSDPVVRENEGDYNTVIGATAIRGPCEGSQTYNYTRFDMQEAFADIGVTEVSVSVEGEANLVTILDALAVKHNFQLLPNEVQDFTLTQGIATIVVKPVNYVWTGQLMVTVDEASPELSAMFPNNVLNGLVAGSNTPPTDGGIYDELTRP